MKQHSPVIMFDLDGTLFDTAQAIATAFNATFEAMQLPVLENQVICDTIGLPLEKAFANLLNQPEDIPVVADCVAEYQRQFREKILPAAKTLLFPGVDEGLRNLKDHHFNLAVTTNKFSRSANALLAAAGIADLFDVVVCADEVREKKPAPESGQKILAHFRAEKEQALMVGDTTHDILMANHLGCKAIAVNYGIHSEAALQTASPTWMAADFRSVVDICHQHFH
ncbi:HAD family hydrolase [Photobacterium sp. 1_MG-2023]|uniref:HAD family hydrolase n=1 Tax=Photobacterium sp. 1_MG-2023 TaxID=3062646 RepID=UPI0026E1EED0|nr:HAD family hydrolase [Photobacterium sp. 1_MG-2023]MDO6708100.1 HAD family hydrolase [Photobacterium sp. 1_MG-2023]